MIVRRFEAGEPALLEALCDLQADVASRLLGALGHFARASGRTLLVLDTQVRSHAEGRVPASRLAARGRNPGICGGPRGRPVHPTAYYFKALAGA